MDSTLMMPMDRFTLSDFPWLLPVADQWQASQAEHPTQSLLVSGDEGVGKRWLVAFMAQHWLGCDSAEAVVQHPDYHQVTVAEKKQVIGVDQIRQLSYELQSCAHQNGDKVGVVWQAESMNTAAANALLKTLEEPIGHTRLVLHAHHWGRLLPTIKSRCVHWRAPSPSPEQSLAFLTRHVQRTGVSDDQLDLALRWQMHLPLKALMMIEEESWPQRQAILQQLKAQPAAQWMPEVERWVKQGHGESLLQFLLMQTQQVVQQQLVKKARHNDWLHQTLVLQRDLIQIQRWWSRNLNQALLLENALQQWWLWRQKQPLMALTQQTQPYRGIC